MALHVVACVCLQQTAEAKSVADSASLTVQVYTLDLNKIAVWGRHALTSVTLTCLLSTVMTGTGASTSRKGTSMQQLGAVGASRRQQQAVP